MKHYSLVLLNHTKYYFSCCETYSVIIDPILTIYLIFYHYECILFLMKKCMFITFRIFLFSMLAIGNCFAGSVPRPPQYVLLAFDGSLNIDMWNETLDFAKKNNIKLSYFISGVYFLLDNNRHDYIEPTKGPGHSNIGFAGDSKKNLISRVGFVNRAYDEGHAIGSHANGHFDGTTWTLPEWKMEFKEFNHLIFDVFTQKGFNPPTPNPYHFQPEQIIGFRSPYLATNSSMFMALKESKFAYDSSRTNSMDYWPENIEGVWNFPLADLRIYGTGKSTLSMDYNFYFSQSGANPDPKNAEKYREEMYKTYMAYFNTNYYGNRAPIHIGHHFSKWNGGAYWEAFGDFAKSVCIKPEVKCVNYNSLLKFMSSLTPEMIKEFHKGNFPKLPVPKSIKNDIAAIAPIDVTFLMSKINDDEIEVKITGKHAELFPKDAFYVWKLNNKEVFRSKIPRVKISDLPKVEEDFKLSAVLEHKGRELLKTSHTVSSNAVEDFILSTEDLEKRASLGDLPEAHFD